MENMKVKTWSETSQHTREAAAQKQNASWMFISDSTYQRSVLGTVTGKTGAGHATTGLIGTLHRPRVCKVITVLCEES